MIILTIRFRILIFALVFTACEPDPIISEGDTYVETIIPTGNEDYLNLDSDYIFNQDSLHTFELIIPPVSYAKINADPAAEEYIEGKLIFNGDTLSPVGIRYKGSIGAFAGCVSGSDWTNPSGKKTCTKLSMKIKINWSDSDDTFFGLKKILFHSQNHDDTQMHERLGYWLFREMGVPAPRSVHARLIINGEYSGLYALTESIDGRFARYNFEDGTGNLYKEIWPLNQYGDPFWERTYLEHLRTNEDEYPNADIIRSFAKEISKSDDEDLKSIISEWMDVDKIIAYAVVDRAIRLDDGAFHWYYHRGRIYNHNYYWYEEPSMNKLYLIPWDLDNAFENILENRNSITAIADAWGERRSDCKPFTYAHPDYKQRSAACDKLTGGWTRFDKEYEQMKMQFFEGPFSETTIIPMLEKWKSQIHEATNEASSLYHDALNLAKWETALEDLNASLEYARQK